MSGSGSTVFAVLRECGGRSAGDAAKVKVDPELWTCACKRDGLRERSVSRAGERVPPSRTFLRDGQCAGDAAENKIVRLTPKPARETRALHEYAKRAKLFAEPSAQLCAGVFAVEFRDETGADLAGTLLRTRKCFVQLPNPCSSITCTIFNTRRSRSGRPAAKMISANFRSRKKHRRPVRHAAAHAPHPMHAAASIARSASCLGTRLNLPPALSLRARK